MAVARTLSPCPPAEAGVYVPPPSLCLQPLCLLPSPLTPRRRRFVLCTGVQQRRSDSTDSRRPHRSPLRASNVQRSQLLDPRGHVRRWPPAHHGPQVIVQGPSGPGIRAGRKRLGFARKAATAGVLRAASVHSLMGFVCARTALQFPGGMVCRRRTPCTRVDLGVQARHRIGQCAPALVCARHVHRLCGASCCDLATRLECVGEWVWCLVSRARAWRANPGRVISVAYFLLPANDPSPAFGAAAASVTLFSARTQVEAAAARLSTTGPECSAAGVVAPSSEEGAHSQPIPISLPPARERAHSLSPKGTSPGSLFGASPLPPHPYSFVVSSNVHSHFSPPTYGTPPHRMMAAARKSAGLICRDDGGGGGDVTIEEITNARSIDARTTPFQAAFGCVGAKTGGDSNQDGSGQLVRRPEARSFQEPLLREGTMLG